MMIQMRTNPYTILLLNQYTRISIVSVKVPKNITNSPPLTLMWNNKLIHIPCSFHTVYSLIEHLNKQSELEFDCINNRIVLYVPRMAHSLSGSALKWLGFVNNSFPRNNVSYYASDEPQLPFNTTVYLKTSRTGDRQLFATSTEGSPQWFKLDSSDNVLVLYLIDSGGNMLNLNNELSLVKLNLK